MLEKIERTLPEMIIIDAGGVLHPDSELGLSNQIPLHVLTGLAPDELDNFQNHELLNTGNISFRSVLEHIITVMQTRLKPISAEELLKIYLDNISFYHNAADMLRHLIATGYKVVLLTNNSDVGVLHTKNLLAQAGLSMINVYGSAEMKLAKPSPDAFLYVCQKEHVQPEACLFIDDRTSNCDIARTLGMLAIEFKHPMDLYTAAHSVDDCMSTLVDMGIIHCRSFLYQNLPEGINRGMYPSFFGMNNGKNVRIKPNEGCYETIDEPNEDGNLRKHCLYESLLAKLICEEGRAYWGDAYNKINTIFLADFKLKTSNREQYASYFKKIRAILERANVFRHFEHPDEMERIRLALINFLSKEFNLTDVSQFYYDLWLEPYGSEPLEPFIFLVDELSKELPVSADHEKTLILLKHFGDLAHSPDSRRLAYFAAQPYVSCGPPQLRGRAKRDGGVTQSSTIGILPDDDPNTSVLRTAPHFAAKVAFQPFWDHPIARELQTLGAPIIGGPSGTLGRNMLMLAPLVGANLLTQDELLQYCMGFWADLVYRGHHSFEEIALVFSQLLVPLKSWLDPIRSPKEFYEQLLTCEFLDSKIYQDFSDTYNDFFESTAGPDLKI